VAALKGGTHSQETAMKRSTKSSNLIRANRRKAKRKANDNRPEFDLGAELERLMGVELRILDGIDLMTVQTI